MMSSFRRPRAATALVLLAAAGFAACTDPAGNEEQEPEIAAVTVISSAGGTATLPLNGGQSGTVTLRANQANTLTVSVLGVNNSPEPVVVANAQDFEVRLAQGGTVRFTSTNATHPFVMTVTPTVVGAATYDVQVYHKGEQHVEFTRPLAVTVIQ